MSQDQTHQIPNHIGLKELLGFAYGEVSDQAEVRSIEQAVSIHDELATILEGLYDQRLAHGFPNSQIHLEWLQKQAAELKPSVMEAVRAQEDALVIPFFQRVPKWAIPAAAVILILITFGLLVKGGEKISSEQLYTQYAVLDQRDLLHLPEQILKGRTAELLSWEDSLRSFVETEEYPRAFEFLTAKEAEGVDSRIILRFGAFLHREAGNKDRALNSFRQMAEDPGTPYLWEPWINLGLTYLRFGERDKAKEAFQEALASPNPPSGKELEDIKQILKQLD